MKMLLNVVSKADWAPSARRYWLEKAQNTILCKYCGTVNRKLFPEPVDIVLTEVPKGSLMHVWYIGIRVFRRNFIARLEPYMKDYVLGKCYDEKEKLIKDYVTCYMRKYLVLRGQQGSNYEVCPECNTVRGIGIAPHYVPRFYVNNGVVFMDSSCHIYVDHELCLKLHLDKIKDIEFDAIPVVEGVVDGQHLPIDP